MILMLFALPLLQVLGIKLDHWVSSLLFAGIFSAVLVAAVYAVSQRRGVTWIAMGMAIPAVLLQITGAVSDSESIQMASHLLDVVFLSMVVVLILSTLFRTLDVTIDTICGALCVFLLLGVTWAHLYSLLDYFEPGQSFKFGFVAEGVEPPLRMGGEDSVLPIYYSFVTLTTLGYGDIVPQTGAARMVTIAEAVLGQLYLTVLVARLVGMHIVHATQQRSR
jgi:voltage-gated potassium channel